MLASEVEEVPETETVALGIREYGDGSGESPMPGWNHRARKLICAGQAASLFRVGASQELTISRTSLLVGRWLDHSALHSTWRHLLADLAPTLMTDVCYLDVAPDPMVSGVTAMSEWSDPPARQELLAELLAKQMTLPAWDPDDGDPPNKQAFHDARAFVEQLPRRTPNPSLFVSGDAEVGFSWSLPDGFVEVAFRGDGYLRYAHRFDDRLNGDVVPFSAAENLPLPDDLATALLQL